MKTGKNNRKSILTVLLGLSVSFTSVAGTFMPVLAEEPVVTETAGDETEEYAARIYNRSLTLNKPVTASAEYSTMPAKYLTDSDPDSRWSTEKNATASNPQWAWIDLGERCEMNYFSEIWESDKTHPSSFNIYVSDSTENWGSPVISINSVGGKTSEQTLEAPAAGRYVKLEATGMAGYPSFSARDFTVMLKDDEHEAQDPQTNVALGVSGDSSSNEVDYLNPSKLTDGNRTERSSRWSCAAGESSPWVSLDLGEEREVRSLFLVWETRKTTSYTIDISDDGETWTQVYEEGRPEKLKEKVVLDHTYRTRYIRLNIEYENQNPDKEDDTWPTISLYEVEVYGGIYENPDDSIDAVKNAVCVTEPAKGDTKLLISLPQSELFDVTYNGADYEQIVGKDLSIRQPLVDTPVTVNVKIVSKATGHIDFVEKTITVPGQYEVTEEDNESISVLPELREWKGSTGTFTPAEAPRIVLGTEDFRSAAEDMAADYEELFGVRPEIITEGTAQAGDFVMEFEEDPTEDKVNEETYELNIDDTVVITASTNTGAYWGTRSVLQGLKATEGESLNKGLARDYPMYSVRGFIMDVGRKSFTLDFLKDLVKQMSWYKMNDFHVHLNDNEFVNSSDTFENLSNVYTGFRLESSIVAGGNNGLNKADLTSKDIWYTKDEFRSFIEESRSKGVHIVPEIDSPAHSAALTKVRPDLALGEGSRIDHLDLINKFEDSVSFVQSIFAEYITGDNMVWDTDTVVNIGADEYNANSPAYRKFVNRMLDYVKETGHKPRVWGSFSQCREGEDIDGTGTEIDLWNAGYANMMEMYKLGFDLINCNDGNYYIVPNAGYYYDYLYDGTMYNMAINTIGKNHIPAGDERMLGGSFALWNDKSGRNNNGVSMYDAYDRFNRNMALFAAKLWGKKDLDMNGAKALMNIMQDAPRTDFNGDADPDANGVIAHWTLENEKDLSQGHHDLQKFVNAAIEETDGMKALHLNGQESYAQSDLGTAGIGSDLRVKVKRMSADTDDQILFESDYGVLKAVQGATGKVGFSREKTDYSFNYTLPVGEWVELEFKNMNKQVSLYVNGVLTDTLGDDETIGGRRMESTNMYPLTRIGSTTNAFNGYVADVRAGTNETFTSAMNLQNLSLQARATGLSNKTAEIFAPALETALERAQEILHQYAPDAEETAQAEADIRSVLAYYPYRKSDTSALNLYASLAQDLSSFTAESADNVRQIVNRISNDLPYAMQNQTDQTAESLHAALQALEVKPTGDLTVVDRTTLKATSSSNQSGEEPSKAIDGSTDTMWHCDWNNTTLPHWLDLEMDKPTEIKGITFTPRSNLSNGTPKAYEIQVSDNGTDYVTVDSGSCSMSEFKAYTFEFDPVTTKHVRFVITASVGSFGSCAEMTILRSGAQADTEGLQAMIAKAQTLRESDWTESSWQALQNKCTEAAALLDAAAADPNAVDAMIKELHKTMCALEAGDAAETMPVSFAALEAAVEEANATDTSNAPAQRKDAFDKALAAAQAKLDEGSAQALKGTAEQYETDKITFRLKEAIRTLHDEPETETANKTLLSMAIAYAEGVTDEDLAHVHPLVVQEFKSALEEARNVMADASASQSQVNTSWRRLVQAVHMLDFTSDKSRLNALIAQAGEIEQNLAQYEAEGQEAFKAALDAAREVRDSDTALDESIQAACSALEEAMGALSRKEVNTDLLAWLISSVENAEESSYTPQTWSRFAQTLTSAREVLNAPESQAQVDAMITELNDAWMQLRLKPSEDILKEMEDFLNAVETLDLEAMPVTLRMAFLSLETETREALNNPELSLQEAEELIEKQHNLLEEAGVTKPDTKPDDSQNQQKPADTDKKTEDKNTDSSVKPSDVKSSVKTAASTSAWLKAAALGAAAGVMALLERKRRK